MWVNDLGKVDDGQPGAPLTLLWCLFLFKWSSGGKVARNSRRGNNQLLKNSKQNNTALFQCQLGLWPRICLSNTCNVNLWRLLREIQSNRSSLSETGEKKGRNSSGGHAAPETSIKLLPLCAIPLLSDRVAGFKSSDSYMMRHEHSTDGNATGSKGAFLVVFCDVWHNWGRQKRKTSAADDTSVDSACGLPPFPLFEQTSGFWLVVFLCSLPLFSLKIEEFSKDSRWSGLQRFENPSLLQCLANESLSQSQTIPCLSWLCFHPQSLHLCHYFLSYIQFLSQSASSFSATRKSNQWWIWLQHAKISQHPQTTTEWGVTSIVLRVTDISVFVCFSLMMTGYAADNGIANYSRSTRRSQSYDLQPMSSQEKEICSHIIKRIKKKGNGHSLLQKVHS